VPPVFMDTAALVALAVRSDGLHADAVRVRRTLTAENAPILTSRAVLTEFLGVASRPPARAAAIIAVDRLLTSARTTVAEVTPEVWKQAFDLYRNRSDKAWSLVDCSSILLCQSRGIQRVFTHDEHFAQAGFEILLP